MSKKFWIAFPVTFILFSLMEFILHTGILRNFYLNNPQGILPGNLMDKRMIWLWIGFLILAFIWTYFYSRFASEKNLKTGIIHGVSYMVFLFVPLSFVNYATLVLSGYCYLWWTIGAIVEGVIIGAIMGIIMKEPAPAK
jgi:hypothetical protein